MLARVAFLLLLVLLCPVADAAVDKLGLDAPQLLTASCRSYIVNEKGQYEPAMARSTGQLCATLEGAPLIKDRTVKPANGPALRRLLRRGLTLTYAIDGAGCVLVAPWGAMVNPHCRWERTDIGGYYVLRPGRRGSGDIYFVPGVTVKRP